MAKAPHPWWELIASPGLSSSATELGGNYVIESFAEMASLSPSDLHEIQPDHLSVISNDPSLMPLIGKIRSAQGAATQGPASFTPSAPPWHVAHSWGAFKVADVLSGHSAKASQIGEEGAESATIVGFPGGVRDRIGPRAKLDILRSADLCLCSAASGSRRWGLFRHSTLRAEEGPLT